MKGLTGKQKNIVEFIGDFTHAMGMAPTIYEIAEHFGIKTSTVFAHIRALQKKDILQRSSKARSISIKHPKRRAHMPPGAQTVPVRGTDQNEKVICDTKLFNRSRGAKDVFAMRVKGADMIGMGILEGDMLLLKNPGRAPVAAGDLLLTEQNGKVALCSCLSNENGTCELLSRGKSHFSVRQQDLPLKGIVIGLQRSF